MPSEQFLEELRAAINSKIIISISGESGTGKTSLIVFLIATYLQEENHNEKKCIWIQASEFFPKKRLCSMFSIQVSDFLLQNIYIAPTRPFNSYLSQQQFLEKISHHNYIFPPDLKYIVIDNISHHLRLEASNCQDIQQRVFLLDTFYNSALFPLILKCQREKIKLFLVHEVSFDVTQNENRKFFYKLYDRINGLDIILKKDHFSNNKSIELSGKEIELSAKLIISERGFSFS
ncbi:MAG: hypothetical protein ACW99E_21285 [Promethearchaeota archaeon]|jgi:archaellum biogenesis ATPase FlaH